MFWPFNFGSSRDSDVSKPTNLDPTLQEFIKAQGPEKYTTVLQSSSRQASGQDQKQRTQEPLHSASSDSQLLSQPVKSSTPASRPTPDPKTIPTLFPDGRYADLWKGYRSLATVDAETKTSAEKIADVLMAYNDRDNSVKRAGMENCWPEGLASQRCYQNPPTAHDRLTLCRDYTRSLERCLLTQVRFMRALGYLSEPGRPKEKEEDIQLHADDLYRRMMKQERMVEDAKRDGKPIPVFAPVLASEISKAVGPRPVIVGIQATDGTVDSPTLDNAVDELDNPALPPEAQVVGEKTKRDMRERLKKLSPEERIIERLAMANEIRAANQTGKFYSEAALEQKAEREARRKAGTASIGDYVSGWLGW